MELKKCKDCGEPVTMNGTEYCNKCHSKHYQADLEAKYLNNLKEQLPKIIENKRQGWYEDCNISLRYCVVSFAKSDKTFQPKAFKALDNYEFKYFDNETKSMILYSPNLYGLGKTHLVFCLVNKIIENGETAKLNEQLKKIYRYDCPVYYIGETQLLSDIRATFNRSDDDNKPTEEQIYKKILEVGLLIIDDVGKVKPKDSTFLQSVYYKIIDGRYCAELPIIITTNLNLTELEKHIGGACSDRLIEMCGKENIIKMTGESYRKKRGA